MAETAGLAGPATAESHGSTSGAPQQTTTGQSATVAQTTPQGSVSEESFFDPKSIEHSPELKAAYKGMQGKWTKEMQRFKAAQKKAETLDSISSNPLAAAKQWAQQNGWDLVQRDPNAKAETTDAPKTWDEVYSRAKQEVLKEIQPMLGEVRQLKQQNVEQYLDQNHADWRTYEDEMLETLKSHPTLAHDPDKLYDLSVPTQVKEARAYAAALAKLKGAGEHAQVSGTGTPRQSSTSTDAPPGIGTSFNDTINWAKAKLAREGITPG